MSISPILLQNIHLQSHSILLDGVQNAGSAKKAIEAKFQGIVEGIPALIANAIAGGGSYAEVMTLREHRDYSCDSWKDRIFSKAPHVERLKGAATVVFTWCQENGLQPFLAPYIGNGRSESRIIIQWDVAQMQSGIDQDGKFIEQLQAVTADAQAQEAARNERERLKEVRTKITELRKTLADYSRKGWTSATLGSVSTGSATSDLRKVNSWAKDIIPYCENLGLTVSIKAARGTCMSPFDYWEHSIQVEWQGQAPSC